MVARVLLNADGLVISKPGIDATMATPDQLLLDMSTKRGQLLQTGVVSSLNPTVVLSGLGTITPLLICYHFIPDGMWDPGGSPVDAYHTPYPLLRSAQASAIVSHDQIEFFAGSSVNVGLMRYFLYREALP